MTVVFVVVAVIGEEEEDGEGGGDDRLLRRFLLLIDLLKGASWDLDIVSSSILQYMVRHKFPDLRCRFCLLITETICVPDSAWAGGNLSEWAYHLGNNLHQQMRANA